MQNISNIKQICKNVLGEKFFTYVKSLYRDHEDEVYPVFLNPNKSEVLNLWNDNKSIRFIILENNEGYVIFDGTYLLHDDVVQKCQISGKVLSGYIDGTDREVELYRDQFEEYYNKKFTDDEIKTIFFQTDIAKKLNLNKNDWEFLIYIYKVS